MFSNLLLQRLPVERYDDFLIGITKRNPTGFIIRKYVKILSLRLWH